MHCSWNDVVSRSTIVVFPECNLRCIHCTKWTEFPLPESGDLISSRYDSLIAAGDWFSRFPRTRVTNVVGGEPLIGSHTASLLKQLHDAGSYVRLWTHGQFLIDHWEIIGPYVDEVAFYLPSPDPDEYRLITGSDGIPVIEQSITWLKHHEKKISFYSLITPTSVDWMPYFHDFAKQHGAPILFTYYPTSQFNRDEIDYIHRFNWVANTAVIRLTKKHKIACPAVPQFPLVTSVDMARLYGKTWVDFFRGRLHI